MRSRHVPRATCCVRRARHVLRATRHVLRATCCVLAAVVASAAAGCAAPVDAVAPLRVCADPNNLPFSNDRGEGFENALAEMLASELGTRLEYTWWPQRRGFLRNTLEAQRCDVVMGMPAGSDAVRTTMPYYRSTYVFVSRHGENRGLTSLDDPRLRSIRIGVQLIGDDFANSPPAHALSTRGLVRNIVGYSVLGDYSRPNPPARIVEAVARHEVDTAVVWGPLAGYFARRTAPPLDISPLGAAEDGPARPFAFDIAIAVRRDDDARRRRLDEFLENNRADIERLLARFNVPRVAAAQRGRS